MWRDVPSKDFLTRYFDTNQQLPVRSMPDVQIETHDYIRRTLGTMIFTGPKHIMTAADRANEGFEPIYTFTHGVLSDYATAYLADWGLLDAFTLEAQRELFYEISSLYYSGGFPTFSKHDWWYWVLTEDALYTELLPTAKLTGGNLPWRTAAELFGKK